MAADYFYDVKNYLDITFTDADTDSKLRGICTRAEAYLSKAAGAELCIVLAAKTAADCKNGSTIECAEPSFCIEPWLCGVSGCTWRNCAQCQSGKDWRNGGCTFGAR